MTPIGHPSNSSGATPATTTCSRSHHGVAGEFGLALDLEAFIALVEEHGTKLATIEGDYNLGSFQGRAMARVGGAMAKADRRLGHRSLPRVLDGSEVTVVG